jgi:hypothetical protein
MKYESIAGDCGQHLLSASSPATEAGGTFWQANGKFALRWVLYVAACFRVLGIEKADDFCELGRALFWHATCNDLVTSQWEYDHDIRDDQALPNLQTTIDETTSDREHTLSLRQACLARLIHLPDIFSVGRANATQPQTPSSPFPNDHRCEITGVKFRAGLLNH